MKMTAFKSFVFSLTLLSVNAAIVFDNSVGLGRKFDGIGGLSGGGATSKLLVNYPEKQRNEILDYLFKPNFGASLHILKVEIGGDAQSTDGTEASHMHNSWDENYERGYEWWLMVEAKKRNPDIKLYALPWAFPGWIGAGTRSPYTDPERTSMYIVKWIQGAKTHYNLTIDFVGIWNERNYDIVYIKTLRKSLDAAGLSHVRIVASDGGWGIAKDIEKDSELANAIDYIGTHYPGTMTTTDSMKTGKQLWASEDYSTFNDNVGGGCWARILNQNYVNGFMTSTISWNLIASYYPSLPFYRDGLMTAVEPWSGNYVVQSPIWLSAHTTQFTQIGWKYLQHGAGVGKLTSGGSHVALVSADEKDLTIIVETFTHDHSICIRPALPPYDVKPATLDLTFKGSFSTLTQLNVWYSKPSYGSEADIFFMRKEPLKIVNGSATLEVGTDEIYTLTTLTVGEKGTYSDPPPSKDFPLPYADDFEAYTSPEEPYNLAPQVGCFEVHNTSDPAHGQVMRQVVLTPPIAWCPVNLDFPFTVGGNASWTDISATVDMRLGEVNGTKGAFLAVRVDKGGCTAFSTMGVFLFIFPNDNSFVLSNDLARTLPITTGKLKNAREGWNTITLTVKGTTAVGTINGQQLVEATLPTKPANGFVGLGTDSWGIADFDNLKIVSAHDAPLNREKEDNRLYFIPKVH